MVRGLEFFINDTNDPSVVKPSVLSQKGEIRTKNAWIWRPQPYTSVKPDSNLNNNTQGQYMSYLRNKSIQHTLTVGISTVKTPISDGKMCYITKNPDQYSVPSYGDYLTTKAYGCVANDIYAPNQTTGGCLSNCPSC